MLHNRQRSYIFQIKDSSVRVVGARDAFAFFRNTITALRNGCYS
jgi:hypothetical protein